MESCPEATFSYHPNVEHKICFLFLNSLCVYVYVYVHAHSPCVFSAQRGQKRALDAPELELQTEMNCHVGAGNQVKVLFKNS